MRRRRGFGFACLLLFVSLFLNLSVSPKVSADEPLVVIENALNPSVEPIVLSTAGLSDGNIGVVYASLYDQIPYYKVLSPSGDTVFETNLLTLGVGNEVELRELKVIGLSGGRSLVSWLGQNGGCGGPYQFMILDKNGNKVSGPTEISKENGSYFCTGQAVELSNGNIVFVWKQEANEYKYRVFDGNGDPLTDPLSVQNVGNRPEDMQTGNMSYVHLAANVQGQFLITYSSDKSNNYIGTLYDSDGTRISVNGYHHFYLHPKNTNTTHYLFGAAGLARVRQ